jgi:hypothetical protein
VAQEERIAQLDQQAERNAEARLKLASPQAYVPPTASESTTPPCWN